MFVLRCVGGNAVCVLMHHVLIIAALPLGDAVHGGSAVCIIESQYAPVEGPSRINVTARLHQRK